MNKDMNIVIGFLFLIASNAFCIYLGEKRKIDNLSIIWAIGAISGAIFLQIIKN